MLSDQSLTAKPGGGGKKEGAFSCDNTQFYLYAVSTSSLTSESITDAVSAL